MTAFRPAEQTHLYNAEAGTRGNCGAACVASIFGLTIAEVERQGLGPACGFQEIAKWTSARYPALEYREQDFCTNFRVVEGDDRDHGARWEYDLPADDDVRPPTCGLWIAHVVSPRGLLGDGPYRGMPILHAVVMRGGSLLWDPHPGRDQGVGQTTGIGYWVAREPGFSVRRNPDWEPPELTGVTPLDDGDL